MTLIAFLGSVFSPYYAWARRKAGAGQADPLNHCAINAVLHGPRATWWAMTERGRQQVERDGHGLSIGPSSLYIDRERVCIDIEEVTVPWPSRLAGRIVVQIPVWTDHSVRLSPDGAHRWFPLAPRCMVQADFSEPKLSFRGSGYFDANTGDAPLEDAFRSWHWSRTHLTGGRSAVMYEVNRMTGRPCRFGLVIDQEGAVTPFDLPASTALPRSGWRIERRAFCEPGATPAIRRSLIDAPFYSRCLLDSRMFGEPVTAFHESLSLERFGRRWVQAMLPFRMPRSTREIGG